MQDSDWKLARWKIGRERDDSGSPLVIVSGKTIGTVASVRAMLDEYDRHCGPRN